MCGLVGCATLVRDSLDQAYGPADPTRHDQPQAPAGGGVSYRADVQPILEQRCVVCHGCYDAPCQLKLGAWEGIARGASRDVVYDAARVRAADPTRLFVDAQRPSQWREKGFFPVLNERAQTPQANLSASVMHRMLALKQKHPLPADALAGQGIRRLDESFAELSAHRGLRHLRAQVAPGRHALRPARAGRQGDGHRHALAGRGRALRRATCRCRTRSAGRCRPGRAF